MNPTLDDAARPTLRDLLQQNLPHLEHFVRRKMQRTLRDQESVTDLVVSVCGDLLAENVPFEYRGDAAFHGWLQVVVANKIRSRLRTGARQKRQHTVCPATTPAEIEALVVDGETPSQHAVLHEDLGLLDRALARLPEPQRDLIVRAHLRGESRQDMATRLGTNATSLRKMLMRAMVRLAGELDRLQRRPPQ